MQICDWGWKRSRFAWCPFPRDFSQKWKLNCSLECSLQTPNSVVKALPSVVLPLALLASLAHPRAVAGVPRSLADGGLGFVLGHEIWHSLDHSGRGFDLQGRLATVWDQASLARWH